MAEVEVQLAPDLERIERGDKVATAEAFQTIALRLAAVEQELRLAKSKGIAGNIPPEGFKATGSNSGTVGTYDIQHPRTGKISVRLGPLGSVNSDRGPYLDSESGMILGGESAYGGTLFEQYYGHWYLVPGHENFGASNDADSLVFGHKQGSIDSSTSVDAVMQIRHDNSLAPNEEYALCPTRSPSGFGAARPSMVLGSTAHADYAWDKVVADGYYTSAAVNNSFTSMGVFAQYGYSAGDFTASGSMTWTVDNADQDIKYTMIGKTMIIRGRISSTDVGGTPDTDLRFAIPLGNTGTAYSVGQMIYSDAGGTTTPGFVLDDGHSYIIFRKHDSTNWTITSGDNTFVLFTIVLEIV